MIVFKFFYVVWKDWGALVTGVATVPLTVFTFWVDTPTQRIAWAIFALACFIYASFRVWFSEYRRAENAEAQLTGKSRPWVTIDGYEGFYAEDGETGEEYLVETLRVVNRGGASAVSIEIPPIQLLGRTARLLVPLTTLGPSEPAEARILNLKYVLDGVKDKVPKVRGTAWSVRIPLTVHYRDASHDRWETDHAISYSEKGISFSIVHPNEPQEWTNITELKQLASI
jgi:hypothetical protein